MKLRVGATLLGEARENGFEAVVIHAATPEAHQRTHQWFFGVNNQLDQPEEERRRSTAYVREIFVREDAPMLEAQQRRIAEADFWSLRPVLLPGDAGAVRARRKLAALIDAERSAAGKA